MLRISYVWEFALKKIIISAYRLTGSELTVEVESGATTRCTLGGKNKALQLPSPSPAASPTREPEAPPFTHAHNVITYHPASAVA